MGATAAEPRERVYGKITEEGLDQLRRRMHIEEPINEPFLRYVNADSIRHVARAIGDMNPLWIDPEHAARSRFGREIAPPAFFYGVTWGSWDMRRGEGLAGVHGLHSRDRWIYYRPVLAGDEIRAVKKLVGLEEKQGGFALRSIIQTREFTYYNQRNEIVASCLMSAFRVERHAGKSRGKYAAIPKARYTEAEIDQIDAEIAAEIVRGAEPRFYEDVQSGEALQPIVRGPLTVSDMIAWMMGIGSPHIRSGQYWLTYRRRSPKVAVRDPETNIWQAVERVHWDPFMAAEIGMPAPYDYGSQRGAWATHLVTNWCGDDGWVAEVDIEYRGMNFLGDVLRIGGKVLEKWRGDRSGIGYVACSIEGINQRGENIMPGRAVIALPSRDGGALPMAIDYVSDGRRAE
ncbi:MAG: MaoC family dehydratase N-terminal domain-containing protein [Acidisphaera sp.]|nr:MaoC family dehydratase N-terminal domain-containing protein [Acidisphaera sp.]